MFGVENFARHPSHGCTRARGVENSAAPAQCAHGKSGRQMRGTDHHFSAKRPRIEHLHTCVQEVFFIARHQCEAMRDRRRCDHGIAPGFGIRDMHRCTQQRFFFSEWKDATGKCLVNGMSPAPQRLSTGWLQPLQAQYAFFLLQDRDRGQKEMVLRHRGCPSSNRGRLTGLTWP